ncbi:MAG: bi-domain-containing oxidoreductase [Deferrisomatales bacterium]|nr:bi-domain-containing oxidoreductase [Deferrisomatales bacterium]
MKQVLQNVANGRTEVAAVPSPGGLANFLVIKTRATIVSAGTERMLVEFGRAGWFAKARQQPDKVRMVLDKVKTDGLAPTLQAVRSKLDQSLPMGYSNVGTVLEVGEGVDGFAVGDRVVSNGHHAEVVCVPKHLCARIPDGVGDEAAAFTVLGAIALQGIRLAQPTLGEAVVVTGLGLIGLLTVQLLKAHGCRVLGIDLDPAKCELARRFGAETVDLSKGEDPVVVAAAFSRGRGVDAVLITASTKSNEPVHQAAVMCRKRGRIVLVGVVGLELSRADFYEKEMTFQVSCSYGPGRYDPEYEDKGQDYPVGFVRWTEQRNFEAVLDMLADGRLDVEPLISHRFQLDKAAEAYRVLSEGNPLGILLQYPTPAEKPEADLLSRTVRLTPPSSSPLPVTDHRSPITAVIGFIGSGNYATQVLIPAFKETKARLKTVASSGGVSGVHAGKKYGLEEATTDTAALLSDPEVNTLVVATRHNSHARYVCEGLKAGKHVFVEKPLCLTLEELADIENVYRSPRTADRSPLLMVGFNRRFSPLTVQAMQLLAGVREPKSFVLTVNAGAIPSAHWTQDRAVGGGRIIGEGCHFIDLLRFFAGAPIVAVSAVAKGASSGMPDLADTVGIQLTFAEGSFGTVHYLANGHKALAKERLEVFCAGRVLQLDNFRVLRGYGWPGFKKTKLWRQDKGQAGCAAAFVSAVARGEASPIPFEELVEVTRATFAVHQALETGQSVRLG